MNDAVVTAVLGLAGWVLGLVILYFIVKAAVLEALKQHTRWQITNRAELEKQYGSKVG